MNELEKELALKDVWVRHHQRCVEICMDERSKLEVKLAEAEYQLEQQKIMNPISVNMSETIFELSRKLEIAIEELEESCACHGNEICTSCVALKEITNEKDKA